MSNDKRGGFKPRRLEAHEITGASVTVRGDDVNGALRKLKKILEGADRQRELAKRESFEKPSVSKKRAKEQAKKRTQRERTRQLASGEIKQAAPSSLKWLKGKRSRRKVIDESYLIERSRRGK